MDHGWFRRSRLGGVPVRFGLVQLGGQLSLESLFANGEFEVALPLPLAEAA